MKTFNVLKDFVVIEGLDGSGTTTQLDLLEKKSKKNGINVFPTMEPTGGAIGKIIRDALRKNIVIEPKTLALLFSADRNEHLYGNDGIIQYINNGYKVISDRYFFSSIAYQSLDCGRDWVISINNFPLPEFLFFIDVPPHTCQSRMKNRKCVELFDDLLLQEKILENYKYGINSYSGTGMKIYYIDGTETADTINEKIWNIINPMPINIK